MWEEEGRLGIYRQMECGLEEKHKVALGVCLSLGKLLCWSPGKAPGRTGLGPRCQFGTHEVQGTS